MKIAILISGRITCYDKQFISTLRFFSQHHDIHLFISVNGSRDSYHIEAEDKLKNWLKDIRYEEFKVPDIFKQNSHPETLRQLVNNEWYPYTVLSCFYNDKMSMIMANRYAEKNGINYDIFCKLRTDMIFSTPQNIRFENVSNTLYSCIPWCPIYFEGKKNTPMCISDAFVYGDLESMNIYTRTYDTILDLNNSMNGRYRINYEPSLTESVYGIVYFGAYYRYYDYEMVSMCKSILNKYIIVDTPEKWIEVNLNSNLKVIFFEAPYTLDTNRRVRDKIKHS